MSLSEIVLVAVGLALDATAVCLAVGAAQRAESARAVFRLAFHFGLFQFLMPVLGWFAGCTVARHIQAWDHWVAFALLAVIGGRMVRAGLAGEAETFPQDPSRGMTMVMLSVATSVDALAVGLSLAMLEVGIWVPAGVIGVITGGLSWLGLRFGHALGQRVGKRMEVVGGMVLVGIGVKLLAEHLGR